MLHLFVLVAVYDNYDDHHGNQYDEKMGEKRTKGTE